MKKQIILFLISVSVVLTGCYNKNDAKNNEDKTAEATTEATVEPSDNAESEYDKIFNDFKKSCIDEVIEDGESDDMLSIVLKGIKESFWDVYENADDAEKYTEFIYDMSYLECFSDKDTVGYEISQKGWDAIECIVKEDPGYLDKMDEFKDYYEENMDTSLSENSYSDGKYKIGTDIPAGEYVIFANDETEAYFCLSSDANGNDIIANDNFQYNSIMKLKKGEYLELSDCYAVPIKEAKIDKKKAGMLKVGKHIKAGEYKLECTSENGAYYCIYNDSRQQDIDANDNFDGQTYVNVRKGQYLQLSGCKIK